MANVNLEINFHEQDEISVNLDSREPEDAVRQSEILLFSLFAARQAANLGSSGGAGLSLAAVLLDAGKSPLSFLRSGPGGARVIPYSGTPGGKRYRASLQYASFEDPASIRFKLGLVGFGVVGRGVSYYAPASVLALLDHLLRQREADAAYVAALAATTRHLGSMLPHVGPANQLAIVMDAAGAGRGELARGGPIDAVEQERLAGTIGRFLELWGSGEDPPPDVGEALLIAALTLTEPAGAAAVGTDDPRLRMLSLSALAGYLWRRAENGETGLLREDLARAILTAERPDAYDAFNLCAAARQCVADEVPLGHGSPGGAATGSLFLEAGFRQFMNDVLAAEGEELGDSRLLRLAFRCGVATHDLAQLLAREPTYLQALRAKPRHRSFRLTRDQTHGGAPGRTTPQHKSFRLTR
jgi:hypothetical protein